MLRKQARETKLRWRVSSGARCSLGRIPKASAIRYRNGQLFFAGTPLSLWDSSDLSKYKLGAGNISEDASGRWYFSVSIRIGKLPKPATGEVKRFVGIDLGLKEFAAKSDAKVIALDRHCRKLEAELGKAQRARKKARVRRPMQRSKTPGKTSCTSFPQRRLRNTQTHQIRLTRTSNRSAIGTRKKQRIPIKRSS